MAYVSFIKYRYLSFIYMQSRNLVFGPKKLDFKSTNNTLLSFITFDLILYKTFMMYFISIN